MNMLREFSAHSLEEGRQKLSSKIGQVAALAIFKALANQHFNSEMSIIDANQHIDNVFSLFDKLLQPNTKECNEFKGAVIFALIYLTSDEISSILLEKQPEQKNPSE